ncbi:MAG: cell division protein FtsQ/DivIB [Alphaproteobacteria bacterium]
MRQLSFEDRLLPDAEGKKRKKRAKRPSLKRGRARQAAAATPRTRLGQAWALLRAGGRFVAAQRRRTLVGAAAGVLGGAFAIYLAAGGASRLGEAIGTGIAEAAADAGYTLQNVYAEGRRTVPVGTVLDTLGVKRGMATLAIDVDAARERLEALEWVRSASVERRLPDTLMVRIVERQPLALWQNDGKLTLIDRDGIAFGAGDVTRYAHLPLVVGAGADKAAPRLFDAMAVHPVLFKRVVAAIWVGERRWNLRFDSGLEARLPEGDVDIAWARLGDLVATRGLLERPVLAVDLRLADRTVIRMKGDPASPANKADQGTT